MRTPVSGDEPAREPEMPASRQLNRVIKEMARIDSDEFF
jgi:hypothetical protein